MTGSFRTAATLPGPDTWELMHSIKTGKIMFCKTFNVTVCLPRRLNTFLPFFLLIFVALDPQMVYRSGQSSPPFTAACLPFPTPAAPRLPHSTGEARTGCMLILIEVVFQTHLTISSVTRQFCEMQTRTVHGKSCT